MKNISIIGVTYKDLYTNNKNTCFVFEGKEEYQNLYGIICFTGAFWKVVSYGDVVEQKIKEKLRLKVQRINVFSLDIVLDPILYFTEKGKHFKLASDNQKKYIAQLIGFCPEELYAEHASYIISTYKAYKNILIDKSLYMPQREKYSDIINILVDNMNNLIMKQHANQFEFMNEYRKIIEKTDELYSQAQNKASD